MDRIDDALCFPLPDVTERRNLLSLYFDEYLGKKHIAGVQGINREKLQSYAKKIHGFSGREISKLMLSLLNAAYGNDNNQVTDELVDAVISRKIKEHHEKQKMIAMNS